MRILVAILVGMAGLQAFGQGANPGMEMANLREDVRGLVQQVGALQLKIEDLERQNQGLKDKAVAGEKAAATVKQLDAAVAEMNAAVKAAVTASQKDTLQQVQVMMEKLGKQTNAAIDALAKGMAARPTIQTVFTDNYPKVGIDYTVQTGDSMASIVKKTGGKQQDIVNANKLADANVLQVGQKLFIPGGK